jgi:hypothetical protein
MVEFEAECKTKIEQERERLAKIVNELIQKSQQE